MMTPSESTPRTCLQACSPLKLSSCCKYRVYYTYITESFLRQPSLLSISALTSLFRGLMDMNMEPATQAWFKKPTICSLSHGKEKNTSESLEIQRDLHDISILITLFLLTTLKPTMIDLPDHLTESFLRQPSLHAISTLTSLFHGLMDTNMEPATQAWFEKPTICSLSHGKEKNTSESLEIQRGLHDISVLITLFLLTTLKPTMIDLPDHLYYLIYLSLSGVSTKQLAMQRLYWYGGQCIFGANHRKQYTVCAHECYYSLFTCQSRSLCSFISKSLSTVGQGRRMHPGSLPKNPFCSTPMVTVLI
jgi:hypothetical protein